MDIVDALLVTLGLDHSQFDVGATHVEKTVDEISVHVQKTASEIEKSTEGLAEGILSFAEKAAGVLGLAFSFVELKDKIEETAQAYVDLEKLAQQFHSTTEALEEFKDAGRLLGLSDQVTIGSLKDLDRAVQDTALGLGRAKKIFEELKISVKDAQGNVKPTTEVMGELAEKFKGMERGKQLRIMERLGLNPALLKLFNADLGDMQKRLEDIDRATGFSLEKASKNSAMFTKSMKGLGLEVRTVSMYFEKLFETAYIELMPVIASAMDEAKEYVAGFLEFVEDHKPFVVGAIMAIAATVTAFLIPSLIEAATAAWAMIAPFIAIGAALLLAVGVFALLYDDWQTWMSGGKSQLGDLWDFFASIWANIRDTVLAVFNDVERVGSEAFGVITAAIKFIALLFAGSSDDIAHAWSNLCGKLVDLFADVIGLLFVALEKLVTVGVPMIWDAIKAGAEALSGWLLDRFAAIFGAFAEFAPGLAAVFVDIRDIVFGVFRAIGDVWDALIGLLTGDVGKIGDAFMDLLSAIGGIFEAGFDFVGRVVEAAFDAIAAVAIGSFNSWMGAFKVGWSTLWDGLSGIAGAVMDWIFGKIDAVIGAFGKIGKALGFGGDDKPAGGKAATLASGDDAAASVPDYVAPSAAAAENARAASTGANANAAVPPAATTNNDNATQVNKQTHIGEITIHTQAKDAHEIAGAIGPAVESSTMADQADSGI